MTEETLLEWQAVAVIDGWADGRTNHAEIIAAIHNQTNHMRLSQSSDPKATARNLVWKSGSDVTKELTTFSKKKKRKLTNTPAQVEKQMAARYGN